MVTLSVIAVFRVDVAYSLQAKGYDPSLRHSETVLTLSTGERFVLSEGESLTIGHDVEGTITRRGEIGWRSAPATDCQNSQ